MGIDLRHLCFVSEYSTKKINQKVIEMGCGSHDPLLTMITLTGAAISYIRICEQGLVNLKDGKQVDLLI